jgi:hypothetical protein
MTLVDELPTSDSGDEMHCLGGKFALLTNETLVGNRVERFRPLGVKFFMEVQLED